MMNPLIQIAPMMDYTDRHCRYFFRLISKKVWLFTEMITAKAILHGDQKKLLAYHPSEHPICLQLGGSDPNELASATKIAAAYDYDEINLNVGCPSVKVRSGMFGACLMAKPDLVARCIDAMQNASATPVSIKTRIGINHQDSYEFLSHFVHTIAKTGCKNFIIHARKAWLNGLSPKENRSIPPLQYDVIYQLKQDFPHLTIILNGGVESLDDAQKHLQHVDGIMIGRKAYQNPYLLAEIDNRFYQHPTIADRQTILANLISYIEYERSQGTTPHQITRHILGFFQGIPGAKHWRRLLSGPEKNTLDFRELLKKL